MKAFVKVKPDGGISITRFHPSIVEGSLDYNYAKLKALASFILHNIDEVAGQAIDNDISIADNIGSRPQDPASDQNKFYALDIAQLVSSQQSQNNATLVDLVAKKSAEIDADTTGEYFPHSLLFYKNEQQGRLDAQAQAGLESFIADKRAYHTQLAQAAVAAITVEQYLIEPTDIPADRFDRDAWQVPSGDLSVHPDKQMEVIRGHRNRQLSALDDQQLKQTVKPGGDVSVITARKQVLRDLPQTIASLSIDDRRTKAKEILNIQ